MNKMMRLVEDFGLSERRARSITEHQKRIHALSPEDITAAYLQKITGECPRSYLISLYDVIMYDEALDYEAAAGLDQVLRVFIKVSFDDEGARLPDSMFAHYR